MKLKTDNLRKHTEELLKGAERNEALDDLNDLQKENENTNRTLDDLQAYENRQNTKRRIVGFFITLPFACFFLYLVISGILSGKSSFTFQRNVKHIYWNDDPYLFIFSIAFLAVIGLVLLYLALVPIFSGKEASGQLMPAPKIIKRDAVKRGIH